MDLAAPITNIEEDLGPPLSHAMKAEDTSSSHSSSSLIRYVALQKTTVLNCPAPPQPLSRSLTLALALALSVSVFRFPFPSHLFFGEIKVPFSERRRRRRLCQFLLTRRVHTHQKGKGKRKNKFLST